MNKKEIIDNNVLIAEFMDLPKRLNGKYYVHPKGHSTLQNETVSLFDRLNYHHSWDWIMSVVDKIAKMGYKIELVFTQVDASAFIRDVDQLFCPYYSKSIDAVYTLCVQFIKWYNHQTAKQKRASNHLNN